MIFFCGGGGGVIEPIHMIREKLDPNKRVLVSQCSAVHNGLAMSFHKEDQTSFLSRLGDRRISHKEESATY